MKTILTSIILCLCLCVQAQTQLSSGVPTIVTASGATTIVLPAASGVSYPSITNGLVLAFPFSPSSYSDTSGNGNNGTGVASPTFGTGLGGGTNVAVTLNGTSQYITVPYSSSINPSAMTIVAWVKFSSFASASDGYNTVGSAENNTFGHSIYVKSNGKLAIYVTSISHTISYDGTGSHTLTTGTWYQVAFTYDSTSGLVGYVNGASDGTDGANGTLNDVPTAFWIGNDPANQARYASMTVELVLMYNRALSSTEISTLNSNSAP